MARYVQEYSLRETKEKNYAILQRFLTMKGYRFQQYKLEQVFCKDTRAPGNSTMVKISYNQDRVMIEIWLKTAPLLGVGDDETGIDGWYAVALKGEMKKMALALDELLGGSANRIGLHPYLAAHALDVPIQKPYHSQPEQERPKPEPEYNPEPKPPVTPRPAPRPQPAPQPVQKPKPASGELVDINRCTQSELMTLPGIGVAQAKKALEYRSEHGGFRSLDEFVEVLGIKPHFAVQIFAKATASQSAAAPKPQPTSTTARRKFDF